MRVCGCAGVRVCVRVFCVRVLCACVVCVCCVRVCYVSASADVDVDVVSEMCYENVLWECAARMCCENESECVGVGVDAGWMRAGERRSGWDGSAFLERIHMATWSVRYL